MIKAIFFDLGGVLFTNGTHKFIEKISSEKGLDREAVKDIMDGDLGTKYRTGEISRDQFWNEVKRLLNLNDPTDELENQWINEYKLIEGTRDLINRLSKKYKIYYLSDNVRERIEKVNQKYDFLKWFNGGVFSHEVGVRKPDPKIYEAALSKAGVRPGDALLIDDKKTSLPPADKLGMKTILFTSPEELEKQLKNLGLI